VFGQLLYNREKGAERKDDRNSLEASLNVLAEWFRYDDPELDITTSATLLPSLEASLNRQRSVLATDLPQQFRQRSAHRGRVQNVTTASSPRSAGRSDGLRGDRKPVITRVRCLRQQITAERT
jgi:hypothetical protein